MATLTRRPEWAPWRERFPRFFDLFDFPEAWFAGERPIQVEEYMDDGEMVVRAELPGVDPDKDVEVTVHDGLLDIRAERRQETKAEDKMSFRSEFRYGMFARTVPLPAGASDDDVKASYQDGVLEVRVSVGEPKTEAKKVPISRR
ncbi:MAG TPA: Hsp20/alpha crystallin family protein [Acidimicrobiales bacterium]